MGVERPKIYFSFKDRVSLQPTGSTYYVCGFTIKEKSAVPTSLEKVNSKGSFDRNYIGIQLHQNLLLKLQSWWLCGGRNMGQ